MASDASSPREPAWRPDLRPQRRPRAPGSGWRREMPIPGRRVRWWSRPNRIAVAVVAFLIFTALLIWASTWLWIPRPVALVLLGADYAENLAVPPNIYGWQGIQDLSESVSNHSVFQGGLRLIDTPRHLRADQPWGMNLEQIQDQTVVLFLALHGGTDLHGAYLLPQNATTQSDPRNRLRLEDVLDRLAKLSPARRKVLILDATQMRANWQLGMLHNDFVRGLAALEPRIAEIPNLIVLSASDVDQRSWVSEEWRQTAFTHALIEGLRGAASDRDRDGRINAWELYQYVRNEVASWVESNRGSVQTPILLPRNEIGQQRARGIDLAPAGSYQPPDPRDTPVFKVPDELRQAWREAQELSSQAPRPEVYAPQLWLRYQDLLLRYELLWRAGDRDHAVHIASSLREVGDEIGRTRHLQLAALHNTLAMPAAAGYVFAPVADADRVLRALWNAPPTEYAQRWAKHIQGESEKDKTSRELLRLQVCDLLIRKAAEDPPNNRRKASALLQFLEGPLQPASAEVHYLFMLQRDLPTPLPTELHGSLGLSLRVRLQAEQAALGVRANDYSYSAQVFPHIAAAVEKADQQRQYGQDLLFVLDAAYAKKADEHLHAAEKLYQQAQSHAAALQDALALRDQIQGELPYYSFWLARRRVLDDPRQHERDAALRREVKNLWTGVHTLIGLLEKTRAEDGHDASSTLAPLAERLRQQLQRVEGAFHQQVDALADVTLPSVWRDMDDALKVPFWDEQRRARLMTNLYQISRRFLIETAGVESGEYAPPEGEDHTAARAKDFGQRQGELALAVLGERWFDEAGGPGWEDYEQVQRRLNTFAVDSRWWESLNQAGEQVAHRWRQLPVEINRLTSAARQADLGPARDDLREADRLTRLIDGAGSLLLVDKPAMLYRRLLVQDLLLWQGQRTLQDHWYAVDPNAQPYYRTAGLVFAEDAGRLELRREPPQGDMDSLRQKLKQPAGLILAGPEHLPMTSERSLSVGYDLRPQAKREPAGYPVLWVESGKALKLTAPEERTRLVYTVGNAAPPGRLTCEVSSPVLLAAEKAPPSLPTPQRTDLTIHGLYRGQRLLQPTRIDLYPLPDRVVSQPRMPERATLTVRGDSNVLPRYGRVNAALVVILDCSGSMGPPRGEAYSETTKYLEATRALREVLAKLPRGTVVSVWAFGQALGPEKTTAEAERTIRRVQAPTRWDPDDEEQLTQLMSRVEYPALEPWNDSPIVRTILQAKEDLRGASGFKSILVITDGMDNRFAQDRKYNPDRQSIPAVLRQTFQDSGIEINLVGFRWAEGEEAQARRQFEVIEKLPVAGKFYSVGNARALTTALDRAMKPRLRYRVVQDDNVLPPNMPSSGLSITPPEANDRWFPGGLPPGGYKVEVTSGRQLRQNITLKRGDLLLLELAARSGRAFFRRAAWTRSPYEQASWRLAVLQNQRHGERGLEMLVALEKLWHRQEVTLEMLKPRAIWIEAAPPKDTTTPFAARWSYQPGYPSAAWSLDVPEWPLQTSTQAIAPPRLSVWWSPDLDAPLAAALDRDHDFQNPFDISNKTIPIGGDKAIVENVRIEDHLVEVEPGRRETRSCLVVRVAYPSGAPVWVRPRGLHLTGHEHRFYTQVHKYTGVFWPVTRTQAEAALNQLGLVSLPVFQREAVRRGFTMTIDDLPPPQTGEVRPLPPVSLE